MRYIVIVALLIAIFIVPVHAQTVFDHGVYQFEDYIPQMSYTGTWATQQQMSVTVRAGTSAGANMTFLASGRYLVIWRYQRSTGISSRYNICVNATCTLVISESTNTENQWVPSTFPLAVGTNTISITQTLGTMAFDYFLVLDDPASAGMPTAVPTVPTATILPSSTPAFTATPAYTATPGPTPVDTATAVPTATPAYTATPYTLPGAIFAIDPAARYSSTNGQITATRYEMAAPDYMTMFLLAAILAVQCLGVGLTLWKRK